LIFHGLSNIILDILNLREYFTNHLTISLVNLFSWFIVFWTFFNKVVKKKRELFPIYPPMLSSLFVLPHYNNKSTYICFNKFTRFRNFNLIPFRLRRRCVYEWIIFKHNHLINSPSFYQLFVYILGPTYSCWNTLHTKPFSTSVFIDLIWIFATTTKICTKGYFTLIYIKYVFTFIYFKPLCPPTHWYNIISMVKNKF